jgi:hypothetical protein
MPSVVDICNKALDKLGQSPITSLDDGNKAANLCSRNWPLIRDQVLRDHPWNFATRRATLAPSSTVPDWGFTASFPLPSACLRVTEVLDLSTSDYQIEGRAILADATVLYVRYVERITDPNVYDASFIDSAATRLAAEMCEALTQNNKKKEMLFSEYDASLTGAKRVDGQENPPVPFEEDDWITARL